MIVGHIGGSASEIDTGDIQKSLRFAASRSTYLNRTFGSGNSLKWTLNLYHKRGKLSSSQVLFNAATSGTTTTRVELLSSDCIRVASFVSNVLQWDVITTGQFRDPSGHLNVNIVYDSAQATEANRVVVSINENVAALTTTIYPTQNYADKVNSAIAHYLGCETAIVSFLDGYLSRVCFVDGAALTPSSFGYQNTEINEWVTKSQSEVKAVVDAGGANSFMLDFDDGTSLTTLGYDKSSKGNNWTLNNHSLTTGANYDWMEDVPGNSFATLNVLYPSRSTLSNGNLTASGTTDFPTITPDSGTWYFERGGVSQTWAPPAAFPSGSGDYNFGQRPWQSTGPTGGEKALNQRNLTAIPSALLDPTDHHIDITVTKSGDTNFTLPWDASTYDTFFEIKRRDAAADWYQIDGLRGYDKILKSNGTAAETTDANVLGVSGTTCTLKSTLANGTYVISATKAGLSASRQTNTDGSITSTVSRNVDSGFAIVTYTGTGANATVGHGLGKAPSMQVVKRRSAGSTSWAVGHAKLSSYNYALFLDTTDAQYSDANTWNNLAPTSAVVNLGTALRTNESGTTFVAYCYADSAIQKSFSYTGNGSTDGPYVNLGFECGRFMLKNSTTGGAGYDWQVFDSVRDPYNYVSRDIDMNLSDVEGATNTYNMDFCSVGVKLRNTYGSCNANGATYIGHAWASVTGKYSNAK